MSSHIAQSQASQQQQKQQAGVVNAQPTARSTATTSKLRMGNGAPTSSSGIQGGVCQSEPPRPRPYYPAPSTITPSESISVRGTPASSNGQTKSSNDFIKEFCNQANKSSAPESSPVATGKVGGNQPSTIRRPAPVTTRQNPPSTSRPIPAERVYQAPPSSHLTPPGSVTYTPPSSHMMPPGSTSQTPPASSASSQQRSARGTSASSTARASESQMPGAVQSTGSNTASRAMGGASAGASQQNYARDYARDYSQDYSQNYARDYSGGLQQQPAGISIGVPQSGNFHFHYNQVDNRNLTIHNNAPGNVTTNNNHVSNVDNSNHHNNNAPQGNTSNFHASNVGNTHTHVNQTATSVRNPASSTGNPHGQSSLRPSESLPIRDRLYKRVKKVKVGEWSDKRTVTYETVPDDRPC